MNANDQRERAAGAFFGRRKGKTLRPAQATLIEELLPRLLIDLSSTPQEPARLFDGAVDEVRLEIGTGGGEHLVAEAANAPETGHIGVEPFVNGLAKTLAAIEERDLSNIRLYDADAARLLDWLPSGSISRVELLYPDPWPKRRHWKRRFVNDENLSRIVRVLKPGGEFRFASDIDTYVNWTLRHILRRDDLAWTAGRPADWQEPWAGWVRTRYEAKAIREGRTPAYLTFRRNG